MDIKWKKPPDVLLTGDSICYNFYTGQGKVGAETFDNGFPRVSTGLENQILRCNYGEIEIEGLGPDRMYLCFENSTGAYVEENMFMECMSCGQVKPDYNLTDPGVGDILKFFWFSFADQQGDAYKAGEKILPGLAWVRAEIAYALGGKACDKDACLDIGHYKNGESWCVFNSRSGSLPTVGGRAVWSSVDSACVPRYPPGASMCEQCGSLGDAGFDFCEASEAWALGNCVYEPRNDVVLGLYGIWKAVELFSSIKYNFIPYYTFLDSLACGPFFWSCWFGYMGKEIAVVEAINFIVSGISSTVSLAKMFT
jgi:hypothetical protein